MYLLLLIQRYGAWRGGLLYFKLNILKTSALKLPELQKPVQLRRNVQDVHAFAQVFVHREYDFNWLEDLRRIVDGGANVGFASLYFKAAFPEAQIHAVEPHPHNAEAFRKKRARWPSDDQNDPQRDPQSFVTVTTITKSTDWGQNE